MTEKEKQEIVQIAKKFLSFVIICRAAGSACLVANRKTHMLYDFDGQHFIPLGEKYEDNFSVPFEEFDGHIDIGIYR